MDGKVIAAEGKYFLEVGGERTEVPAAALGGEATARELSGADVEVLLSEPVRQVIALLPKLPHRPPILCYLPPPDLWRRFREIAMTPVQAAQFELHPPLCYIPAEWMVKGIDERVRQTVAARLLKEGIISRAVHDKLA